MASLSPAWEQAFIESIVGEGEDKRLAMAPSKLQEFVGAVEQPVFAVGQQPGRRG